jgi:hypothetical protein
MQESGEPGQLSSAPEAAMGPSGRSGRETGGAKGSDTVVHIGDSGRRCCGMSDPLLAATLVGKLQATKKFSMLLSFISEPPGNRCRAHAHLSV